MQFVVNFEGKRTGALLSMAMWEALMDLLENQEDAAVTQQALTELKSAGGRPEQAGLLAWELVKR